MKKIVKTIFNTLSKLLVVRNYIFFESVPDISDNSSAIYYKLLEMDKLKKYKFIWLVQHKKNDLILPRTKQILISRYNFINKIKEFYYISISRFSFYTHGRPLISPKRNQTFINLWHGCGLKKANFVDFHTNFNFVMVTSDTFKNSYIKNLNIPSDKILILGNPRTDFLFEGNEKINKLFNGGYEKTIIWMPTFRKSKKSGREDFHNILSKDVNLPIIENINQLNKLNQMLTKYKSKLIIKPHPSQELNKDLFLKFSNITIVDQELLDYNKIKLYNLIGNTDALISDYSSVYVDYLLTKKPILFTIDDMDNYKTGFMFKNPLEYMPGPIIDNYDEFFDEVSNICKGVDKYKTKRIEITKKLHENTKNNISEKIINFFEII